MAFLDKDGAIFLWAKVKEFFVAKESGKGLSANDYTTDEKNKLSGIATGATKNTVENVLTSTSTTNALSAYQGKVLDEKIKAINTGMEDLGAGDMMKATYDTDGDGVVDNAKKVNGHTVEKDVPSDAVFTDTNTTYAIEGRIVASNYLTYALVGSDDTSSILTLNSAESTKPGLMSIGDKLKLDALPTNTNLENTYAKKTDITGVYKYKGSVAIAGALPTTGQTKGDVYNIESASVYGSAGANVAWNGTAWDSLGEIFTITAITNAELETICV